MMRKTTTTKTNKAYYWSLSSSLILLVCFLSLLLLLLLLSFFRFFHFVVIIELLICYEFVAQLFMGSSYRNKHKVFPVSVFFIKSTTENKLSLNEITSAGNRSKSLCNMLRILLFYSMRYLCFIPTL